MREEVRSHSSLAPLNAARTAQRAIPTARIRCVCPAFRSFPSPCGNPSAV